MKGAVSHLLPLKGHEGTCAVTPQGQTREVRERAHKNETGATEWVGQPISAGKEMGSVSAPPAGGMRNSRDASRAGEDESSVHQHPQFFLL